MKKSMVKKFSIALLVIALLVNFSIPAFALSYKPSGYNNLVGAGFANFSGTSKEFTFNIPSSVSGVYLETRVYDPGASYSAWNVYLKVPGATNWTWIAWVATTDDLAPYDYEYFTYIPSGTCTVRVENITGATNSNMKAATFFVWDD